MIHSPYILILIWLVFMVLLMRYVQTTEMKWVFSRERETIKWWFAILVFIPFIIMAVTRDSSIGDTGNYIGHFQNMPSSFSALSDYYFAVGKDRAYYTLGALIKCIFGDDYRIYFLIIAMIHGYGLLKLYRRYSPDFLLSIFLFLASTDYISWMQNGARQFVAVSISLLAASYIMEKKYVPAVIIVLIASRFHQSALLVIPIIFIVQGQPWNKRTLFFIFLTIIAVLFVNQFTNLLDTALEETQYSNVVSDWQRSGDDGTNPLRVLIYSLPAILSLIGLRYIREENDTVINFATNMSIIASGLYIVSMVTSGIFIGRLPIYASLYSQGILLPWEIEHMFNHESVRLMKMFTILFYIVFYFYQMKKWGLI